MSSHGFYIYIMHTHTCHLFFFFNDTATTEIYTLSLHDALPICLYLVRARRRSLWGETQYTEPSRFLDDIPAHLRSDRKSTRLNSSHDQISYAVFCLKKKKFHSGN